MIINNNQNQIYKIQQEIIIKYIFQIQKAKNIYNIKLSIMNKNLIKIKNINNHINNNQKLLQKKKKKKKKEYNKKLNNKN